MTFKKKTYLLAQELIDEMKSIYKTKTETEAIMNAMREISFKKKLSKWHGKNQGKLHIKNLYVRPTMVIGKKQACSSTV